MSRSRPLHLVTFVAFVAILVAPWVAGQFGASSDTVERRAPAPLPELGGSELLEASTFAGINDYVRDRTPLRGHAKEALGRAWLALDASSDPTVVEGPDGYFFLSEDFTEPCARGFALDDMTSSFALLSNAAESGGKELLFLIAPDKGTVLDYRLTDRAAQAASCAREARAELRTELDNTGLSFDLAPALIEADKAAPDLWYYEHDSHWTFSGGDVAAETIVNQITPGLYDRSHVSNTNRSLPINGDIFRRLGVERTLDVPDPVHTVIRPNTVTDRSEVNIDGTRTVRTYLNTGGDELIAGRTVVAHDSMMNFAERQIAAYFEEIVFIHWDDRTKADFLGEAAKSDRVILMSVERSVNNRINNDIINATANAAFAEALATEPPEPAEPDPDLPNELLAAVDGLRAFTRDTGEFVQDFDDLLVDPGVDGWSGPYVEGDIYTNGSHPQYGLWQTVQRGDSPPDSITGCADFNSGDCATWLLLADVPLDMINELDVRFDGGDGLEAGRVRYVDNVLYFYSLA